MDPIVWVWFILGGIIFVAFAAVIYYLITRLSKRLKEKYVPKRATQFKCLDGHITRSKGELIIDNHLTRLNIEHEYEQTIQVRGQQIKYDWYLPEYEVYIEYWGYFGKEYLERRQEKIELYEKDGLNLISIEDVMLEDIYKNLEEQLKEYIPISELKQKKKFCPKCGEPLDARFQ